MRVLVQIPAKNEEQNIADVIGSVPRKIKGVDEISILVIDDSSTDSTIQKSIDSGADFVVKKNAHHGLANSFSLGSQFFLARGFDILVNTDGDNQYNQETIPELIQPLLLKSHELVVGDRLVWELKHFSTPKKVFQKIGSGVISSVAGVSISDAASGFRAYSRELVARINVTTKFSYAMESLIQAAHSDSRIATVACGAKAVNRPSRLFTSSFEHVRKSAQAILRGLVTYRPLATFIALSSILGIAGLIPFIRYLILTLTSTPGDHIQSLILGVILLSGAFTAASLAVLSDLIRSQRIVLETKFAQDRLQLNESQLQGILDYYRAELVYEKSRN